MGQSTRSGALAVMALVAYATLCHGIAADNDEISLEREQIFVNLEGGTTFSFMIEPDDTIQDLLFDLHEYEGINWCRRRFKLGDIELTDSIAKLSDLNIRAGAMLTLVVPGDETRGTTKFTVKTRDGRGFPVKTRNENSVADLKENITRSTGIPRAEQRLLLRGKELKDDLQLVHYDLYDGTVHLGRPLEECRRLDLATISVITPSGATIKLEANLAETVADLKERIRQKTGVPVGVQRLSSNENLIAGDDHLCDLGLGTGSIVYMYLYSSRITDLAQVTRLAEPAVNAHEAPIFRELGESVQRSASLYKDTRNWIARPSSEPAGTPRPGWDLNQFDPTAYLNPNPDGELWLKIYREKLEALSQPNADGSDQLRAAIIRAQIKLSSAVREHRVAANLTWSEDPRQQPGITLAGEFTSARGSKRSVPLGADVNNWAPDAFSDADVMRLFEVSERIRQVLARAAQTGQGILTIASQRQINQAILFAYLGALDGCPPSVEYNQAREGEQCGICRDDLTAEPAIKLACEHAFHADCVHSWVTNLYQQKLVPSCPSCRQRFMFPYDAQGKAVLELPGFQGEQD